MQLKDVPAAPMLQLKSGAQVLLLANLDITAGLVNGSRGIIVDWIPAADAKKEEEGASLKKGGGGGGAGFGGEEWRDKAAQEWVDRQREEFLPMVFFACGVTSELFFPVFWSGPSLGCSC